MFVVAVDVVMMMVVIAGVRFGGEPFLDIGNLFVGIIKAAAEQPVGGRFALGRIKDRRCRIECAQPRDNCVALSAVGEIGLGQDNAVRHGGLLDRFGMGIECRRAVDRIDHREHAIEPVAQQQIRMRHRRVQNRRRIGQPGGFQQHAAERAAPVVEIAQ